MFILNRILCKSTFTFYLVDCVWDDWKNGDCSEGCGTGQMTSTRIKLVKESMGGICEGEDEKTEDCNTQLCKGIKSFAL